MFWATAILSLACGTGSAYAAQVTELAPAMRGDAGVRYDHAALSGSLVEESTTVARRAASQDTVTYGASFSLVTGAAVFVEVPSVVQRKLTYSDANQMLFDPVSNRGSMLSSGVLTEPPSFEGSGLEGVWVGLRATPFNEAYTGRGNRVTWLIELATRSEGAAFSVPDETGARGGGAGGTAHRARMAFSARRGVVDPYLRFEFLQERAFGEANGGEEETSDPLYDPADHFVVDAGVELVSYENESAGSQLALDVGLTAGYYTWQTLPSGLLLPSTLTSTADMVVTESEYAAIALRFGVYYRIFENLQVNLRSQLGYEMSHQLEHPYVVRSGYDSLLYGAGVEMQLRVR